MNTFPARLDTLAKMITIAVIVVLIIPFITIGQHYGVNHDYKMLIAPVLITVVVLFAALYKPQSFLINASVLKISQVGFARTILTANIESIQPIAKEDLGRGYRTLGSGGFLGYLGKFWYTNTGHITFYVTDKTKMLLVTLKNGKKIMISPDDSSGFLQAFRAAKS